MASRPLHSLPAQHTTTRCAVSFSEGAFAEVKREAIERRYFLHRHAEKKKALTRI